MAVDSETWRNSRPKKRMGAGVLVRDALGRALPVEQTYKSSWEIPGGSVEADESPRTACVREVAEELGFGLRVGRLLCFEWQGPEPDRTESPMLVYDGGVLPDAAEVRLAADELASFRFVEAEELDGLLSGRLARRVRAAQSAIDSGTTVELDHGVLMPSRTQHGLTSVSGSTGAESPTHVWPEVTAVTISAPHQPHLSQLCLMLRLAARGARTAPGSTPLTSSCCRPQHRLIPASEAMWRPNVVVQVRSAS